MQSRRPHRLAANVAPRLGDNIFQSNQQVTASARDVGHLEKERKREAQMLIRVDLGLFHEKRARSFDRRNRPNTPAMADG